MFGYRYHTSTFSNKEGASDRVSQRKALVSKLHHEFNGEADLVQQHIADITHRCNNVVLWMISTSLSKKMILLPLLT